MYLVIIFNIYIGLCAFQVLYKHKLIHLIFYLITVICSAELV